MEFGFKELFELILAIFIIVGIGFLIYKLFSGQLFPFFKGLTGGIFLTLR